MVDRLSQDKEMSHLFDTISCHAGLHFCLLAVAQLYLSTIVLNFVMTQVFGYWPP